MTDTNTNKQFTNQSDIFTHLLAGGKLKHDNIDAIVYLNDGVLVSRKGDVEIPTYFGFFNPRLWHSYEEPNWYDNIPAQGVLCWVSDASPEHRTYLAVIKDKRKSGFSELDDGLSWKFATPLTKEEVQKLIYEPSL